MEKKTGKLAVFAAGTLLLAGCQAAAQTNEDVVVKGAADIRNEVKMDQHEFLTRDEAKQIAFDHAGVDGSKVQFDDDEFDRSDRLYEFEFKVDNMEYEYDIHAVTGKILEAEKDEAKVRTNKSEKKNQKQQDAGKKKEPRTNSFISLDTAKEIALNHAGLSRSDVEFDDVELEKDDGIKYYEIEFESGNYEYEYDIHAGNGSILDYEVEYDD